MVHEKVKIKIFQNFLNNLKGQQIIVSLQELSVILNCSPSDLTYLNRYDSNKEKPRYGNREKDVLDKAFNLFKPLFGEDLSVITLSNIRKVKYYMNPKISVYDVLHRMYQYYAIDAISELEIREESFINDSFIKLNNQSLKLFLLNLWDLLEDPYRRPILNFSGAPGTGRTEFIIEYLQEILLNFKLITTKRNYLKVGTYLKNAHLIKLINENQFLGGIIQIDECNYSQKLQWKTIESELKKIVSSPYHTKTVVILSNYESDNKYFVKIAKNENSQLKELEFQVVNPSIEEIVNIFPNYIERKFQKEITTRCKILLKTYFQEKFKLAAISYDNSAKFKYLKEMNYLASSIIDYKSDSTFPDEIVTKDVLNCKAYLNLMKNRE